MSTTRLELRPLPAAAAAALLGERDKAAAILNVSLPPDWPHADLLDVLPLQAAATGHGERFGIWLMIERETNSVIGDIGFLGPPQDGLVEIGYSVIPNRRRRGYATEATVALTRWALSQPDVAAVSATCDRDNIASIRTLERVGFRCTHETHGRLLWRVTRRVRASDRR